MSIIVVSGETISKNLQNSSKSKQMYSFPKSKRFIIDTKNSSRTFYYNLPVVTSKRATSIGYGKKSDFTKGTKWNAPFHEVPRLFEDKKDGSPKYTFGLSRDYFKKMVVNDTITMPETVAPGVGKYNINKPFGSEAPKYSMVKRYPTLELGDTVKNPGPGKYNDNITINSYGKFPLSKFSNTARTGWSLSKVPRFIDKRNHIKFIIFNRCKYSWTKHI